MRREICRIGKCGRRVSRDGEVVAMSILLDKDGFARSLDVAGKASVAMGMYSAASKSGMDLVLWKIFFIVA